MLDLNKCVAGRVELRSERCSLLLDVLQPVQRMLGRAADTSRPGLRVSVCTSEPLWVDVDALRLKQVRQLGEWGRFLRH